MSGGCEATAGPSVGFRDVIPAGGCCRTRRIEPYEALPARHGGPQLHLHPLPGIQRAWDRRSLGGCQGMYASGMVEEVETGPRPDRWRSWLIGASP